MATDVRQIPFKFALWLNEIVQEDEAQFLFPCLVQITNTEADLITDG